MSSESHHPHLTHAALQAALPAILRNLPQEWRGTTFRNSNLLGRGRWCTNLQDLIQSKGANITTEDLVALGNAEDYLRVSSNISTLYEVALAAQRGTDISQVFTFSSSQMPILAVLLTVSVPVHVFVGEGGQAPFSAADVTLLEKLGGNLQVHQSAPAPIEGPGVVLSTLHATPAAACVDGVLENNVLYITNTANVQPAKVLVIRKRMSTPMTTPMVEAAMQRMAGMEVTADTEEATPAAVAEFHEHLQTMCGTAANPACTPLCCTSGLTAIASLWFALVSRGGADVLMASTAYGGSSELTDILNARADLFTKHNFDIQGQAPIAESIETSLNALSAVHKHPTTVLMVEIPTNPDMKVPDMQTVASMLASYQAKTGKAVLLLADTTFAPGSAVMGKMAAVAPDLPTMVFISMSKSVSRGLTTAGTLVAGHTAFSQELVAAAKDVARMLDTAAKRDQMLILTRNHTGVEDRCARGYANACAAGEALQAAVRANCAGAEMPLAFVTPAQGAVGFHTSTFSFNLPAIQGAAGTEEANAALAQRFVDLLTVHAAFKPCVSFGQDNGLVYATVPATSTQGAIKAEHKAKQAVGGVQLVRLSFPPTCDTAVVCQVLADSVATCYAQ